MEAVKKKLEQGGILFKEQEPLARHTTFSIGGPCDLMLFPRGEEALISALQILKHAEIVPIIFGNGSNLLVCDAPLPHVFVKIHEGFGEIKQDDNCLQVQAGALLSRTAVFAQKQALAGFEFAHGIPGTMGGGLMMNAGAYGGELCQVVESLRYLDEGCNIQEISGEEAGFSYRHSRFCDTNEVILSATLALAPGNPEEILAYMKDLASRRREKQPLEFPSAGSTFKRPPGAYAAALIDQCGLKGYAIGGAQVSPKHAGFVINRGGATCRDVLAVMDHVREVVYKETGFLLEAEVKQIGMNL